jgi:methyl-accepting chemotaxis protein
MALGEWQIWRQLVLLREDVQIMAESSAYRHKYLRRTIRKELRAMAGELDRLTNEVAETRTATKAIVTLVEGLAQQIRDNAGDPEALNRLADELDAAQQEIADAVSANTKGEQPPAEEPPAEEPQAEEPEVVEPPEEEQKF